MEKRFDVRVCKCGHVHFVDIEVVDKALEEQKPLLLICGHCGLLTAIGGDEFYDEDTDKTMYNMYTYNPANGKDIDTIDTSKYSSVIYSEGKRIMMKTGYPATSYNSGVGFQDTQFPDGIWDIAFHGKCYQMNTYPKNMSVQEYLRKWAEDSVTVSMNWTLSMMTDDEQEALSHYMFENLDFTGTKYETEWNKNKESPLLKNYKKYEEDLKK